MVVTLREIAKRANVSHATVSVVLNERKHPVISELTKQKVIKVAKSLGYQPNPLARALATGRSGIISVWPPDIITPVHLSILQLIYQLAHASRYKILLHAGSFLNTATSSVELQFDHSWNGDGIIALDCPNHVTSYIKKMQDPALIAPIISLGSSVSVSTDNCSIDIAYGISLILRHFKETGKSHIAFLTSSGFNAASDKLSAAFFLGISQMGLSAEVFSTKNCARIEAYEMIKTYINEGGRFDAVLAYNSLLAVGALAALRDVNMLIPKQVSVISCDDSEELLYQYPPVTALQFPIGNICKSAWEIFQKRLDTPEGPIVEISDRPTLIVRASSAL